MAATVLVPVRTTSSTAAEKNAVEDVDKRDSSERSKFINKQSIASFQKEIEDELKSEPSHVLCGRVSRDPKDELHVQALRDKFAVIPASVSWSGLKRLLKLYYSNARGHTQRFSTSVYEQR